jgi:hypothetical protein
MGTVWPKIGTATSSPTSVSTRSSSGWMNSATHAGSSSGRVVAISTASTASVEVTAKVMSLKWLARSASSVSTCEIAVSHSGHQIAGASLRYCRPRSVRSMNESWLSRWTAGEIVWYVCDQSIEMPSWRISSVNSASKRSHTSRVSCWNAPRS